MKILGVHDGHNSSACLLVDGTVKFAIQEERLRKIKNYWGIPELAISNCLSYAGLTIEELDAIVIASENQYLIPNKNISRENYMSSMHFALEGPFNIRQRISINKAKIISFFKKNKFKFMNNIKDNRGKYYQQIYGESIVEKLFFIDHHISHYATAAFGSGFWGKNEFLVFTNDGHGDDLCASVYLVEKDGKSKKLSTIEKHHSIANFYGIITACLGFNIWEDEYKIMGMAPYANPEKAKNIGKKFLEFYKWKGKDFNMKKNIKRLMDRDERQLKKRINDVLKFERFDNICGGIQYAFEHIISKWIDNYVTEYNIKHIALAGGAFMNVKSNLKISELSHIKKMFVYPSCGDETISIGAAMMHYKNITNLIPSPVSKIYYGNDYYKSIKTSMEMLKDEKNIIITNPKNIEKTCADLLAKNQIIARFSGRSEFGARALGNRSILANPCNSENISIINDMVKKRDFWMPFACSILEDEANKYIENPKKIKSPYMILAFRCNNNVSKLQAGTHPRDGTIRPQLVTKKDNPKYYRLIDYFREFSGIGGVLNTSFNLHGLPLVETPQDAIKVFLNSGLKYLSLEEYLISKRSN